MMTKPTTDCESKGLCYYDSSRRPRFFHGMLLTDEHLQAEQKYHRDALRRINRYLWGDGIVCGLEVENTNGLCIKVHPGLALDCHGHAIELCKAVTIDVWSECKKRQPTGCDATEPIPPFVKHLVIRYVEIEDDPEPVFTPADDCTPAGGQPSCQKSRVREGFCLELRDTCKDDTPHQKPSYSAAGAATQTGQTTGGIVECITRDTPKCPECACDCGCGDCWIGLATLTIDCTKRTVEVTCDCRDYARSPRRLQGESERQFSTVRRDLTTVYGELRKLEVMIEQRWDPAADERVKQIVEREYVKDLKQQIGSLTKQVDTLQKALNKMKGPGTATP
jgi:hypothetical protein